MVVFGDLEFVECGDFGDDWLGEVVGVGDVVF